MNIQLDENVGLSEKEYLKMASTARDLLRQRRDNFKGIAFEEELSGLSGVASDAITRALEADDTKVGCVLTGRQWERVLSSAHVYPEDLLEKAGLSYRLDLAVPQSEYAASHHDDPQPSKDADRKIRALFDVMSDFFFVATVNVKSTWEHADAIVA